jgi:hypothetical protein
MVLIAGLASGRWSEVSPHAEATAQRERDRVEAAKSTIWATGCRSWYLDDDGVPAAWPWSFSQFAQEMSAPVLAEYDLRS